eukprot:GHVN01099691.1.p1 GENE.GHVN01099691.1~~GHVN01099691.1.p1  ORF type:complete len:443 (+),score=144.60 GHVN01099691.1:25-1329(+)
MASQVILLLSFYPSVSNSSFTCILSLNNKELLWASLKYLRVNDEMDDGPSQIMEQENSSTLVESENGTGTKNDTGKKNDTTKVFKNQNKHLFRLDSEVCKFTPGRRALLEMVCGLTLRCGVTEGERGEKEMRELAQAMRPCIEDVHRASCSLINAVCGPDHSRGWMSSMSEMAMILATTSVILHITQPDLIPLVGDSPHSPHATVKRAETREAGDVGEGSEVSEASEVSGRDPLYLSSLITLQNFMDGFEWGGVSHEGDLHIFLTGVLVMAFVLVGGMVYCRTPERRRRFLPPPYNVCGFIANGARRIEKFQDKMFVHASVESHDRKMTDEKTGRIFVNRPLIKGQLKNKEENSYCTKDTTVEEKDIQESQTIVRVDESLPRPHQGCVFIRHITSLAISRAEKASAVLCVDSHLLNQLRQEDEEAMREGDDEGE